MNAPENINSLRQEIAQHLASTGEATAKQIADLRGIPEERRLNE